MSPLALSILLYQLLSLGLYVLIFEKDRLQGAVWTAVNEGDDVAILHKYLVFGIWDHNFFLPSHCQLDIDPVFIYQLSS